MNKPIQLSFFEEENNYVFHQNKKIDEIEQTCDKMRKSLYARNNFLEKKLEDTMNRLAILERNICNG